jgi:hypothetical protein
LLARLGDPGDGWVMLGAVSASGTVRLYATEQAFTPASGATVLYFGPERVQHRRDSGELPTEHREPAEPTH